MNKPAVNIPVSGIFVSLLMLLVTAGFISSSPALEAEMIQAQRGERVSQEAHLAVYERHLANLGIDRLNCR